MFVRKPPPKSLLVALPFVASAALFLVLTNRPGLDPRFQEPAGHFYIVSAVSLTCLVLAVLTALATFRVANLRVTLLALAFLSMAGFFSIHGLATPGFIVGSAYYNVVGFSARIGLLFASLFLLASAFDWPQPLVRALEPRVKLLLFGWSALLAAYAVLALLWPEAIPPRIMSEHLFLRGTLVIVCATSVFASTRYLRGYRHSGLPMYGAVAMGAGLLCEAQVVMHFGTAWYASWWMYHLLLLGGFGAILGGLMLEAARGHSAGSAIERLAVPDALTMIEAGYSDVIRALAASLEARDPYTHGHGRRVAALAYLVGRELGLSPGRLRGVVQGALLHDIGKIGVPDGILLKPGKLNFEEYEEIKKHPAVGERLLASALPGAAERAVIRHHHEWYDGSGYPDGLEGDQIPLEARIVAVADVYDALRSDRAYRPAWRRSDTLELMAREAGSHLDPLCVEAFTRVVDRFEVEFSAEAEQSSLRSLTRATA